MTLIQMALSQVTIYRFNGHRDSASFQRKQAIPDPARNLEI